MTVVGFLPGHYFGSASAISADGSTIVGLSRSWLRLEAFRWRADTGMVGLGQWPTPTTESRARLVSEDGAIVYGSTGPTDRHMFRWTEQTGLQIVGELGNNMHDMTPDGVYVVGQFAYAPPSPGTRACIWDEANGLRLLEDLFAAYRFDLSGWGTVGISGISADGRTISGGGPSPRSGTSVEAFIARILRPGDVRGDLNGDGEVGAGDMKAFSYCLRGPAAGVPAGVCAEAADVPGAHLTAADVPDEGEPLVGDGAVDLRDFAALQRLVVVEFVMPECETGPVVMDLNGDCVATPADMVFYPACMNGPERITPCLPADLDGDEDVDLADFAAYQRFLLTPGP
jgi:hypothetical protein